MEALNSTIWFDSSFILFDTSKGLVHCTWITEIGQWYYVNTLYLLVQYQETYR